MRLIKQGSEAIKYTVLTLTLIRTSKVCPSLSQFTRMQKQGFTGEEIDKGSTVRKRTAVAWVSSEATKKAL